MADIVFFNLWMATVFSMGQCCPELCSCFEKYNIHFADCACKGFVEIPSTLPPNTMTISLTANRISLVPSGIFDNVTLATSLWLSHNELVSIEEGSLAPLINLRNLDISHNHIVDFPWEDLKNLTALTLLKMSYNKLVNLPGDAFSNLKDLRALRLNNNRFITIAEGTFDGLISLSQLQIFNNPFACNCSLDWFRSWILTTTITIPQQDAVVCANPEIFKGNMIGTLPESKCASPSVTISININSTNMYEDVLLVLTCEFKGNPEPVVTWTISSEIQRREFALSSTEDSSLANNTIRVYSNGTLIVSRLRQGDSGNYSCSAINAFGKEEDLVSVEVVASPKPKEDVTATAIDTKTHPPTHQTATTPVFDSTSPLDFSSEELIHSVPISSPAVMQRSAEIKSESRSPSNAAKCGLTATTQFISSHAYNRSMDDIKQYTFDFGVIALGVSETEATVRLNPLLIPKEANTNQDASSEDDDSPDPSEASGIASMNGLYLCVTNDRKRSAVQWSRIKEGVNTYQFSNLHPSTNYSLCLTYRGEDCEVQVLFSTRRRAANLLIIISVSICLLTVSTVPLLAALCFHLVYKYRSKTYKLILKAQDQYHMKGSFNLRAPYTESQRKINGSQLDGEDEDEESQDKEADTEESMKRLQIKEPF
ncbi:immunoglobulin superfamily containing leucine-rich repeat protein 2-like isoform X2 [Genypterus blacodes]|uniref:immunoglobulin superfamily containing leucine-rich repeat protein 2-like isoform X2 n=1 Tax=Genypterus blacodes TaxID=154954 RepID=UPI003F773319